MNFPIFLAETGEPSIVSLLLPFVLMAVVFYFLLIRPQQKRQKKVTQMQAELKKGDKIITIGGMHGVIDSIDEGVVRINVGNQKLTYEQSAIKNVVESVDEVPTIED